LYRAHEARELLKDLPAQSKEANEGIVCERGNIQKRVHICREGNVSPNTYILQDFVFSYAAESISAKMQTFSEVSLVF
jgi:hypothetical protein